MTAVTDGQSEAGCPLPMLVRASHRAERPAGDIDWDSGISLQDSDQSRTFGPKLEPRLSPRHEEAKHLLQRARMKARTRPLRASHDVVPALARGSRDGRKSTALDPRMTLACKDNLQNGNTSDSSSGESSSGQWPKRGASPSHVRFEDESARDAESRYLERLQQRQRQVLSSALQPADQGPLRSKPDLADYIHGGCRHRGAGAGTLHPLLGGLEPRGLPAPPTARVSERRCRACGHRVTPDPRVRLECEAACSTEGALAQPRSSRGLSAPLRLLLAEPRLRTESIRETHIGEQERPEEVDSALDSTDTSDSCRTDSEEAGSAQPSRARGSSPRPRGCRPRGGHRLFRKADTEPPRSPQAPHYLPGLEPLEVSDEVAGGTGHMLEGTDPKVPFALASPSCLPTTSCPPFHFRTPPGASAGPGPPSAAPSDRNKKSSVSTTSALGLKKFFLALSQGPRPKMGKSRSYSVEQLQPPAPGPASHSSTPAVKRAPSLQSLHLVSPSRQHRKAASFQSLQSLLSGKVDRSNLYLVGEPGDHRAAGRPAKAPPRRALSVEDVSAPGLARTVGRVLEVFPDGTSQLQLQRSPEGTFGFCVASGNGRRDSGFYVQEMADESTAKLYSGLLGVGDEILEVNGAKVAGLGLAHIQELLAHAESLSIRVLRQRPVPR
ncbi:hypothetical protein Cadr_000024276 [Camelus dromedarius]|uniref:PDZ domain-containing protein n=1 Tax=Camelus dromedarius TaxID=9838 RepID=A0A5N4CPT0_CAMDR|nr:hypothetical protein Cadr_000024276 [Camelus dromedarius]